jgi:Tol biopolymer transport system component
VTQFSIDSSCAPSTATSAAPQALPGDEPLLLSDVDGLYVINPDGTGKTLLFAEQSGRHVIGPDGTSTTLSDILGAKWTLSRDRIVGGNSAGEIVVSNRDGTNPITVVPHGGGGASWSPDGERLAFVCEVPGAQPIQLGEVLGPDGETHPITGPPVRICMVNADGTGEVVLTPEAMSVGSASWAPDGNRLVFVMQEAAESQALVVLDLATGTQTKILTESSANAFNLLASPDWSPDGTTIAFSRKRPDDLNYLNHDLWAVNADGAGARQLTDGVISAAVPNWSPDGSRLAFVGPLEPSPPGPPGAPRALTIYVIDREGGQPTPVPNTSVQPPFGRLFDW